jgi:hypothetical protein
MQATIQLQGESKRGGENRTLTIDMVEKSQKHSELDRYLDNLTYTIWEAMRIVKTVYGWDRVTSHKFIGLV